MPILRGQVGRKKQDLTPWLLMRDAGPPDYGLADLDRSRNDIGAQGGPWSIGQYDAQRQPSSLAPFVYPLFKADSSIFDGNLEVQALGVARLR